MKYLAFVPCALLVLAACGQSHSEPDAQILLDLDGARLDGGPPDGGPSNVGTACGLDEDCTGTANLCLSSAGFLPNGYCSLTCIPMDPASCPEGSQCVQISMTEAYCFDSCDPAATTRECRAGYGCASGFGVPPICIGGCTDDTDCPMGLRCDPTGGASGAGSCFDPAATLGAACTASPMCPMGATCLEEDESGWPSGACVGTDGCDVATDTGCGTGAHCIPGGFSGGICVAACATTDDCRLAYTCRAPSAYPTRSICQPACSTDAHCTATGYVCNPGLGTCDDPFVASSLGRTCSRFGGGCTGGTCLSERQNGFPNAYCAYQGCTVGMDSTCPTGGVCSASGDGLGICLDGCAADADCRMAEGYACRPVDYTGTMSTSTACVPACTSDAQCTRMGFVCNPGTGRCGDPFGGTVGAMCADATGCPGGRCLTDAAGWPGGTCAAPGCRLTGTGPGFTCPAGSACADDGLGDPEIGHCLAACVVGGAATCRTGYECRTLGGADPMAGACQPMPPPAP
jgi:hypothetical protein